MLISFAVTAKLIRVFVSAYAKSRFSYDAVHIILSLNSEVLRQIGRSQQIQIRLCLFFRRTVYSRSAFLPSWLHLLTAFCNFPRPFFSSFQTIITFLGMSGFWERIYRKVPKFSDARRLCCNLPKIQTKRPNLRVFHQKDANGIANIENSDQTAPRSSLIWVCTVCRKLSVQKLWIITVINSACLMKYKLENTLESKQEFYLFSCLLQMLEI